MMFRILFILDLCCVAFAGRSIWTGTHLLFMVSFVILCIVANVIAYIDKKQDARDSVAWMAFFMLAGALLDQAGYTSIGEIVLYGATPSQLLAIGIRRWTKAEQRVSAGRYLLSGLVFQTIGCTVGFFTLLDAALGA